MSETFTDWDAAQHLRTREDARLYLEACAEQDPGDGSLIRVALGDIVRVRNMSSLARKVGMTRQGLYKALSTEGNPSFATVMRITRALGMDLRITFGADPGNGQQAVSPGSSPHPAR
jgi:probable addiction module antidote protein